MVVEGVEEVELEDDSHVQELRARRQELQQQVLHKQKQHEHREVSARLSLLQ